MRTCKCLERSSVLLVIFVAFLETSRLRADAAKSPENTFWYHVGEQDSTTLDTTKEDTRVDEPTEPTSTQTVTQESIYHQEVDFTAIKEDEQNSNIALTKRASDGNGQSKDESHRILSIIQNFLNNHSHNQEAAYEELMEMMAIVAANPEQWHRIREIWEQHSQSINTKPAKVGPQRTEKTPFKSNKNPLPKLSAKAIQEANSVMLKGDTGVTAIPESSPRRKSQRRPKPKGRPKEMTQTEPFQGKNGLHHHHHHNGKPKGDFAIERPVTVIGERSQVDPVEQELIEAAANRRFKTLEQVKQGGRANAAEENEEQLHTLSKMTSRLKQHRLQKEKLRRKLKEQNLESMDQQRV